MNFLACGPGRPVVSSMKGTRLMCGYLSNFSLSALLDMCPGRVLAAETRDGLQEKGATIETSRYVTESLRLKTTSTRAASESKYFLFNGVYDVCQTSGHCCMPAIDAAAVSAPMAVALFEHPQICHRFDPHTKTTCCRSGPLRFCWGRIEPHLQQWELPDVAASISWLRQLGNSGPQPRTLRGWAA